MEIIVESLLTDSTVTIKSQSGADSFTYTISAIDSDASNESLMALCDAVNSIQRANAHMIIKSETVKLSERGVM